MSKSIVSLIVIVASFSSQIFGQVVENKSKVKIAELKASGIDTLVCYYVECYGYVSTSAKDSCQLEEVRYIYWPQASKFHLQRLDNCYEYEPVLTDSSQFWKVLKKNISKIKTEEIKPPQHTVINKKGKKEQLEVATVYTAHTCTFVFELYIGETTFKKYISDFDLYTERIDETTPNDNYKYNQQTQLKKLKDLIEVEVNNVDRARNKRKD